MKRITAALLAAALLFLCACSGGETNDTTTAAAAQTAATLPIERESSREAAATGEGWAASLLPEVFATEPAGCITLSTKAVEPSAFKSPYTVTATRITLRCLPEHMQAFSQQLVSLGYLGGVCFYENHSIYQNDVVGHWTNDEYIVTINDFDKSDAEKDGMQYTLTVDVVKCENKMPEILTKAFPDLKTAWTRADGDYKGFNSFGGDSSKPDETLSDVNWMWSFKGEDAFFGVTRQEYEQYLLGLTTRGFDGYAEVENDGVGTVEYYSAEYTYGTNVFGVYLCYIPYLSTLEMIFSNDITFFYSEETAQ